MKKVKNKNTICTNCGHMVKKANFCSNCGFRIAKICNCHIIGKPYDCGYKSCPDINECILLLLNIHKDQQRRKYIFLTPMLEALDYKSLEAIQKLGVNKSRVLRPGSFHSDVWYKIY